MKYLLCLLVLALSATCAFGVAYTEQYEFTIDPTQAGGAVNGNLLLPGSDGSGFTYADGIGTYLDDSSSGNFGLSGNNAGILNGGNYSMDFRVKVLANCGNEDWTARSMSFRGVEGGGRGLQLNLGNVKFTGNAVLASADIDLTDWVNLRFIQNANVQSLYVLGSDVALMSIVADGSTGQGGILTTPGFALGAHAGGSTDYANFQLDWVRFGAGTDALAVYDPVPEPGSMLALASGLIGMAGFAIRRRRA